jgi:AraC family transcriptional regulator
MSNQVAAISNGSIGLVSLDVAGFRVTDAQFPPRLTLPSHYHPRACLAVVLEGSIEKSYRQAAHLAPAASVLTMPPEERHADQFQQGGAHMLVIEPGPATDDLLRPYAHLFACGHRRDPGLTGLAWRLSQETHAPDTASPLAAEGLILEMLARLARQPSPSVERRRPPWLGGVEERLYSLGAAPCDLSHLAAEVGVHPVHLARVFRAHFGVSIGAYVRRLRLDWAAHQLAVSNEPLSALAVDAGFVDQSHFTRAFKQHTGLTPGQYRQARR